MKKILLFAFLIAILASLSLPGGITADYMSLTQGSGQIVVCRITAPATASAAAVSGQCGFFGIVLKTDSINNVTLNIYDNTAASGTRLIPTNFVIPGTDYYFSYSLIPAVKCDNGIYVNVNVAGSGTCSYQVLYDN